MLHVLLVLHEQFFADSRIERTHLAHAIARIVASVVSSCPSVTYSETRVASARIPLWQVPKFARASQTECEFCCR